MAAAACGTQTTSSACTGKLHREHLRKSRDSRRRQAALLFLTNISLDGRPVLHINNPVAASQGDAELEGADIGSTINELTPASSTCGPFPNLSSCSGGCPVPRFGILNVPPILVLPSDAEYGHVGSTDVDTTEHERGSISSQGHLLSPSSLQPTPLGTRKSPTLLSVHSCNSSLDSRQRTRNLSGSSRPRPLKKVHFIKSMRQYDTRGSRIVLVCARGSLCAAFSVLPYGESFHISDPTLTNQRRRHSSGGISSTLETLPGLDGVELGMYGSTVSYAQFLYPTNALVCEQAPEMSLQMPYSRNSIQRSYPSSRLSSTAALNLGLDDGDYDPNLLSDPQWPCGKHKRVLIFASYMTTVIEYVKPSDLKKDMNETFKEKFPHIRLTLSKIRSLKREIRVAGEECGLQPSSVAMAFAYFEKLVLQGRLSKANRKLVAAACLLLAAKISSDLRKPEVKQLIDKLEERFRISRRELIAFEFNVLVALEMALYLPESKVMPHYRRLVQQS
ncbi:CDK5 and ABL1 enzyme substrate 2 [Brachyhypopomus gauderio]|uniref:CDK5 and ABL1 enzyme substrate 2 n=1 Tax=Brachyhypopomus gauderio TaxID=698409 RepID=UPI004041E742